MVILVTPVTIINLFCLSVQVSEADPNVSRLIQEYEVQSANTSFDQLPPLPANPPPQV